MSQLEDQPQNELVQMRYFTPALVMQLNCKESEVVDRAMERWEQATVAYKQNLQGVFAELRPQSHSIADLSLHD